MKDKTLSLSQDDSLKHSRIRIFSRWVVISCCMVASASTATSIGLVAAALEDAGISVTNVALICVFGNFGGYSGVLSGIINGYIGPRYGGYFGAALICMGYMLVWMSVTGAIPQSVPLLCIAMYFAHWGVATVSSVSQTLPILAFPPELSGVIVSVSKAYWGAGTSILGCVAGSFFSEYIRGYLLFVAIYVPLMDLFVLTFVNYIPEHLLSFAYEEAKSLPSDVAPYFYHVIGVVALIFSWVILSFNVANSVLQGFTIVILIFLASVLLLPLVYYKSILSNPSLVAPKSSVSPSMRRSSLMSVVSHSSRKSSINVLVTKSQFLLAEEQVHRYATHHPDDPSTSGDYGLNHAPIEVLQNAPVPPGEFSQPLVRDKQSSEPEDTKVGVLGKDMKVSIALAAMFSCLLTHISLSDIGNASITRVLRFVFHSSGYIRRVPDC
jgi:hypothetical protein